MNSKLSHDSRLRCDMVDIYYTLFGLKEPADVKDPEVAALYQPQKVEPSRDIIYDDDVKIELDELQVVHVKDFVPGPSIEDDYKSIEIETEPADDSKLFSAAIDDADVECLTIEAPVDEPIVMKSEVDDFMVLDSKILSDVEIIEPVKKKPKIEYPGSDNSVSQPGDFNLEGHSSATMFSGDTKEHKVRILRSFGDLIANNFLVYPCRKRRRRKRRSTKSTSTRRTKRRRNTVWKVSRKAQKLRLCRVAKVHIHHLI